MERNFHPTFFDIKLYESSVDSFHSWTRDVDFFADFFKSTKLISRTLKNPILIAESKLCTTVFRHFWKKFVKKLRIIWARIPKKYESIGSISAAFKN